ncbi:MULTISPECIES: NADPH-dependent FMN reductase [Halomonadaceae]|jgi:NAD(P)H-dependent FMN reductase|uniref:NAD(P)H-dependent oxidoreductase n=1 Tax=Vreelandella piezotolerans TaxID=2609667 RepID=A0ABQ6X4G2_9GAMM|nr:MULTISPECIES: NAD(P)H-dependent oxidoreductase [Halomonas]KAE8436907.1 NAD(P)H-dependent oxidoreductase [Halomonas piezotolerans]MCE8014316.1 hypothetical protein [Halomonas desiderata]
MKTVLFLAGSTMHRSVNSRLSLAAADLAEDVFGDALLVQRVDLMQFALPPIDQEAMFDSALQEMVALFARAEGLFISSDEYTGSFSAQIRLAVNWLMLCETAETPLIADKPTVLAGAAPIGVGGMRGFPALQHLLKAAGLRVFPQQIRLGTTNSLFDTDGALLPAPRAQLLNGALRKLADTVGVKTLAKT